MSLVGTHSSNEFTNYPYIRSLLTVNQPKSKSSFHRRTLKAWNLLRVLQKLQFIKFNKCTHLPIPQADSKVVAHEAPILHT